MDSTIIRTEKNDSKLVGMPRLTGVERLSNAKFREQDRPLMDHYYVQNQSLSFDIEIIVKTVFNG